MPFRARDLAVAPTVAASPAATSPFAHAIASRLVPGLLHAPGAAAVASHGMPARGARPAHVRSPGRGR